MMKFIFKKILKEKNSSSNFESNLGILANFQWNLMKMSVSKEGGLLNNIYIYNSSLKLIFSIDFPYFMKFEGFSLE